MVAAQAAVDSSGNCGEEHPWVFYSHDGGQHWKEEIVPNLTAGLAGGDPAVVYDPKDHVFVYSFIQFSRTDSTNTINVTSFIRRRQLVLPPDAGRSRGNGQAHDHGRPESR